MPEQWVWLEYPATGGKAKFPAAAAPAWRAKGWQHCDPPAESEPELEGRAEPGPTTVAEPATKPKSAGRKRGGETTTAPEE